MNRTGTATLAATLLVVTAVFTAEAGTRNCKPAWKCAPPTGTAPSPTPRVTASPMTTPMTTPQMTFIATPAPTTAPTVAPTASPSRPFPPPTTTRTVTAPNPTGGDDFASLNAFIEGVPDGSVIVFPDGVYRLSQGVMLGSRQNLVLQLGNAEFRLTGSGSSHFSSAFIPGYRRNVGWTGGAAHISFIGGVVVGNDTCPGCPQPLRGENQQAVRCNGSRFIEVTGMEVRAVSGDGAFFDNCDDVWVHHNEIVTAGRNGWTLIKGYRHLVEDNVYRDCGYAVFDIEPNFQNEPSGDVLIRRNTAGGGAGTPWQNGIGLLSVDGGARQALIERVTFDDNTSTIPLQVYVGENRNVYTGKTMRDITVTDNTGPTGGVVRIAHVTGYTVSGNSAPTVIVDSVP